MASDAHGLEEMVHDPLVPISRFELPRLFLGRVIVVDDLMRMLKDFDERGLEGVDAQFLVYGVRRGLRMSTMK